MLVWSVAPSWLSSLIITLSGFSDLVVYSLRAGARYLFGFFMLAMVRPSTFLGTQWFHVYMLHLSRVSVSSLLRVIHVSHLSVISVVLRRLLVRVSLVLLIVATVVVSSNKIGRSLALRVKLLPVVLDVVVCLVSVSVLMASHISVCLATRQSSLPSDFVF